MRFALFFPFCLLPSLAMAQANPDCLVEDQIGYISGKVAFRYTPPDTIVRISRQGYVISLLRPRCFVEKDGQKWDTLITEIEIYVPLNQDPPINKESFFTSRNGEEQRKQFETFLKTVIGKNVTVKGNVNRVMGPSALTNPIIDVLALASCQISPISRNVKKC